MRSIENGFIYEAVRLVVICLNYINPVEWFKWVAGRLAKDKPTKVRGYKSLAIDIFIVAKFAFVALLWRYRLDTVHWAFATKYLVFMNLFTYFVNHVWDENPFNNPMSLKRTRRRFVSLSSAVAFSCLSFAYLYDVPYAAHFLWDANLHTSAAALHLSISNAFGGSFFGVEPMTDVEGQLIHPGRAS